MEDWRFVAEGNAHVVYRCVATKSGSNRMVLKLRKSDHEFYRSREQHQFVTCSLRGNSPRKNSNALICPVEARHLPRQQLRHLDHELVERLRKQAGLPTPPPSPSFKKIDQCNKIQHLLEQDLVTPPVDPLHLLSVQASLKGKAEQEGWIYFTAELKPKSGLPIFQFSRKSTFFPSRFTLQQFLKKAKGSVSELSEYCPERFFRFVSFPQVVRRELESLLKYPQNNLRLFIDGMRIFWGTPDPKAQRLQAFTDQPTSRNLPQTNKGSTQLMSSVSQLPTPQDTGESVRDLFLRNFPFEIEIDQSQNETPDPSLSGLVGIFSKIIVEEKLIFHKLSIFHALSEGQQYVANAIARILEKKNSHNKGGGSSVFTLSNLESVIQERLLGFGSVAHLIARLGNETGMTELPTLFEAVANLNGFVDEGFGVALKLQRWHYSRGVKLLKELKQSSSDLAGAGVRANAIEWLARFLLGRTFLDCSVMVNLAIAFRGGNTEILEHLKTLRFQPLSQQKTHSLEKEVGSLKLPIFDLAEIGSNRKPKWKEVGDSSAVRILYRLNLVDLDVKHPSKISQ